VSIQYLQRAYFILQVAGLFCLNSVQAQTKDLSADSVRNRSLVLPGKRGYPPDKDMGDVLRSKKKTALQKKTPASGSGVYHYSMVPAIGYTLQTGFAGIASVNLAYNNDTSSDIKLSSITTSITYSQYNQTIIPLQADIWTKGNKINFISDNRYIAYPSDVYGLGGRTDPNTRNYFKICFKKPVSGNGYLCR
jgi:hypothetical protein